MSKASLLCGIAVGLLSLATPALAADVSTGSTLLRFVGRLHPALIHFPIALFIAAAFLELARLFRRRTEPSPTALTCLLIAAAVAVFSAFSGWMNADFESHAANLADTLFWHRWLGVSVATLGVVLSILALTSRFLKRLTLQRVYSLLLLAVAIMVGITGHLGGTMVYGPGYYLEAFNTSSTPDNIAALPADLPVRTPPEGATLTVDFAKDIQPIFTRNCIECHGPSRHKAGLRLDNPGFIFTMPEDEQVVVPGEPGDSEIIRRVSLKPSDEGHMPPRGDPLPADQVDKLKLWISEGAYWAGAPTAAQPEPATRAVREEPDLPAPPTWTPAQISAIESLRALGGRIEPIAAGSTDLDINLSLAGAKITDATLRDLEPLAAHVQSLNLARTPITDAGMTSLGKCTALRTLHLENTGITDAALEILTQLPHLEYLNLNETKLTDAGLAKLAAAKPLRKLYVWHTAVSADAVISLRTSLPSLDIDFGEPPGAPTR